MKNLRLLNDEEIAEEIRKYTKEVETIYGTFNPKWTDSTYKRIAKAQHKLDIEGFIEWGDEYCHDHQATDTLKRQCYRCWQSLKDLI